MNALDKLLIMQPAVASKPDAPPLLLTAGRIAFDNVTFAYTEGQQLLRGVSFAVEPGQTMANPNPIPNPYPNPNPTPNPNPNPT